MDYFDFSDRKEINKKDKNKLKDSDYIIVCTFNGEKNREQLEIAEELAKNSQVIMVALQNPYDYKSVKDIQVFITTYDYSPSNQKAAADIITGKIKAKGKLPVTVRNEKNEE